MIFLLGWSDRKFRWKASAAGLAVAALICGGVGILGNYTSAMSMLEQTLSSTAGVTAQRISYELASYRNAVSGLGMVPELSNAEVPVEQKEQIVQQWADYYGMERGNLLNASGDSLFDGNNYSDRPYFQTAMQGVTSISSPTISKITGELSIMVAAPLWQNGVEGGTVAGVVYFVPKETFLNDIMISIQVSENSGAYMIDSTGVTIADTTLDTITVQNIEQEAASDPLMVPLLLAFGLNEFSMSASAILRTRRLVTGYSVKELQAVADEAMSFSTAAEIEQYMRKFAGM